jgi:hypothetical protein
MEVDIDTKLMQKIRKGSAIFKTLKDLFIIKDENGVFLKTGNSEGYSKTSNSYSIQLTPTTDTANDFSIAIPIENFLSLPQMDYTMKIKYNEKHDSYRITFENEIFKFILAVKV